jgi:hypothetical protein
MRAGRPCRGPRLQERHHSHLATPGRIPPSFTGVICAFLSRPSNRRYEMVSGARPCGRAHARPQPGENGAAAHRRHRFWRWHLRRRDLYVGHRARRRNTRGFAEAARLLRPQGVLVVSTDYWPEKIELRGPGRFKNVTAKTESSTNGSSSTWADKRRRRASRCSARPT